MEPVNHPVVPGWSQLLTGSISVLPVSIRSIRHVPPRCPGPRARCPGPHTRAPVPLDRSPGRLARGGSRPKYIPNYLRHLVCHYRFRSIFQLPFRSERVMEHQQYKSHGHPCNATVPCNPHSNMRPLGPGDGASTGGPLGKNIARTYVKNMGWEPPRQNHCEVTC